MIIEKKNFDLYLGRGMYGMVVFGFGALITIAKGDPTTLTLVWNRWVKHIFMQPDCFELWVGKWHKPSQQ